MAGIARVVTRVKLGKRQSDAAYWRAQPPLARLAALEEIRREYHCWKYGAEPRLQRVYTIITKRASGRFQDLADLENLE